MTAPATVASRIAFMTFAKLVREAVAIADQVRRAVRKSPTIKALFIVRARDAGGEARAIVTTMVPCGAALLWTLNVPALIALAEREAEREAYQPAPHRAPFGAGAMVRKSVTA